MAVFPWRQSKLPAAPGDRYAELVKDDGEPVWPVADDDDRSLLFQVCRSHGGQLEWVEWAGAQPRSVVGAEVLSLGAAAERPGRLYAHLTGRRHRHAPNVTAADLSRDVEVVVATADQVSYALLEALYDPDQFHNAPGMIIGVTETELRRNVLVRSGAAALQPREMAKLLHFELQLPIKEELLPDRRLIGRNASAHHIEVSLGEAKDLLVVSANSDGVDANLGSKVLCAVVSLQNEDRGGSLPYCLKTGTCHRLQLPMRRAFLSDRLLAPSGLSARAVLLRLCFGLLPDNALYDFRYGFLRQIASNPAVGVILTSWETAFTSFRDTDELVGWLTSGIAIGKAVAQFNRSAMATRTGDRLCVIGDPLFRFNGPDAAEDSRMDEAALPDGMGHDSRASRWRSPPVETPLTKLRADFLHTYFAVAHGYSAGASQALFESTAVTLREWQQSSQDLDSPVATQLRKAVTTAIATAGTMPCKTWMSFVSPYRAARRAQHCFSCGMAATRMEFELHLLTAARRRLINCPRCGIVEDAEIDAPTVAITLHERRAVSFALSAGYEPWEAAIRIEDVGGGIGGATLPVAAGQVRGTSVTVDLPGVLGPSASFVGLVVVDGLRLSVARIPCGTRDAVASRHL